MSEQNNGISDAEIAGIMGWRGPGAYTEASLRKIKKVIDADREKFASQSPAPIPEQVAQASGLEGLEQYMPRREGGAMQIVDRGNWLRRVDVERLLATQSAKQPEFSEADIPADAPRAFAKRYSALLEENHALKAAAQSAKQGAQIQMLQDAITKQLDSAWECNSDHPALAAALKATEGRASVEQAPVAQEVSQEAALDDRREKEYFDRWPSTQQAAKAETAEQATGGVWFDGPPPHPYGEEWFIARTIYGDCVVLKALPEEHTYDYQTADETYMLAKNVKCWMQFPDSEYIAPDRAPTTSTVSASGAQWISVDDCLPDLHQTVALLDENRWMNTGSNDHNVNWHGAGYLCEFGHKFWSIFGESRSQCLDAVTHWMPIPDAPETAAQAATDKSED